MFLSQNYCLTGVPIRKVIAIMLEHRNSIFNVRDLIGNELKFVSGEGC